MGGGVNGYSRLGGSWQSRKAIKEKDIFQKEKKKEAEKKDVSRKWKSEKERNRKEKCFQKMKKKVENRTSVNECNQLKCQLN